MNRVVEDDIRPTMTQYALDLWSRDPVFDVCRKVLNQCFQAVPQLRGDIVDIHNDLVCQSLLQAFAIGVAPLERLRHEADPADNMTLMVQVPLSRYFATTGEVDSKLIIVVVLP